MTEIIHKELSYNLVGCIFDVHNEVGPGVREECYQKAMEHRLRDGRIPFIAKPATRRELVYRGEVVDIFELDFVVAEKMILELKHQVEGFVPENESQVLNYLKFWNLDLGLLANFALDKAHYLRIPRQPPPPLVSENYDYIASLIQLEHKPILRAVRDGLSRSFNRSDWATRRRLIKRSPSSNSDGGNSPWRRNSLCNRSSRNAACHTVRSRRSTSMEWSACRLTRSTMTFRRD